MKRICSLCLGEYPYQEVKKYKHCLQLCDLCHMVVVDIAERRT